MAAQINKRKRHTVAVEELLLYHVTTVHIWTMDLFLQQILDVHIEGTLRPLWPQGVPFFGGALGLTEGQRWPCP